jgi:hypothetical protein
VAKAAAMAPLKAGSIFQGRLAETIPAQSPRWPRGPVAAKRASTSMALMSSSGGSTLRKGPTNSADRGPPPPGVVAPGPGSFVLSYSSRASRRVASRTFGPGLAAPKAGTESPATPRLALTSAATSRPPL